MNDKDEALAAAMRLVLADAFENYARIPPGLQRVAAIPCVVSRTELSQAARLLRRQQAEIERLREALESIAANACCDKCQEAALVAKAALRREET